MSNGNDPIQQAIELGAPTTGALPSKPSSLQRDTTLSYIFLSSLVRGENDLMCL